MKKQTNKKLKKFKMAPAVFIYFIKYQPWVDIKKKIRQNMK